MDSLQQARRQEVRLGVLRVVAGELELAVSGELFANQFPRPCRDLLALRVAQVVVPYVQLVHDARCKIDLLVAVVLVAAQQQVFRRLRVDGLLDRRQRDGHVAGVGRVAVHHLTSGHVPQHHDFTVQSLLAVVAVCAPNHAGASRAAGVVFELEAHIPVVLPQAHDRGVVRRFRELKVNGQRPSVRDAVLEEVQPGVHVVVHAVEHDVRQAFVVVHVVELRVISQPYQDAVFRFQRGPHVGAAPLPQAVEICGGHVLSARYGLGQVCVFKLRVHAHVARHAARALVPHARPQVVAQHGFFHRVGRGLSGIDGLVAVFHALLVHQDALRVPFHGVRPLCRGVLRVEGARPADLGKASVPSPVGVAVFVGAGPCRGLDVAVQHRVGRVAALVNRLCPQRRAVPVFEGHRVLRDKLAVGHGQVRPCRRVCVALALAQDGHVYAAGEYAGRVARHAVVVNAADGQQPVQQLRALQRPVDADQAQVFQFLRRVHDGQRVNRVAVLDGQHAQVVVACHAEGAQIP